MSTFATPRLLPTLGAAALVLSSLAISQPASADDASTLTVVGTSDVYDSNLVQTVIKPGFEAAYPDYTLNYVSKGTGAAIAYAEAGTASAMLVHAAALENQFVDAGYSYEKYGRAIFWGDYVLLGPASDPAGVLTDAPHDIATAFEKVAEAGAAGEANFVSRGGTPGTTVQEHAIWSLTDGVTTCDVSDVNGGGTSPSTASGACPDSISYPSWYHATGLTQGPNIINGDACNYPSDEGNCYVFTDRGTFNYLDSTGAINDLQIVTRDNDRDATGGQELLVNSFHAYAVNPDNFTPDIAAGINLPAAQAFLDWITSPDAQTAVGEFLSDGGDPPFLPSASPTVTVSSAPAEIAAGDSVIFRGSVKNVVPGTPVLDAERVRLWGYRASDPGGKPVLLDTTRTNDRGRYRFEYEPRRSYQYEVRVPSIVKIENDQLDPVFGDILAPAAESAGTVDVRSKVTLAAPTAKGRTVSLRGQVAPTVTGDAATIRVLAVRSGTGGDFEPVARRSVAAGSSLYKVSVQLPKGSWDLKVRFQNPAVVLGDTSATRQVSVG